MRQLRNALYTVLALMLILSGCASPPAQQEAESIPKDTTVKSHELPREYMNEGFIDDSTFRVVILAIRQDCGDKGLLQEKGERRALTTLSRLVQEHGGKIDHSTKARILQLIRQYGTFDIVYEDCENRNIYWFTIRKEGLKDDIACLIH